MNLRRLRRDAKKGHASQPVRLPPPPIPPEALARRHQQMTAQQAKADVIQKTMAHGSGIPACPHCGSEPRSISRDRESGIYRAQLVHTRACPASGGMVDPFRAVLEGR